MAEAERRMFQKETFFRFRFRLVSSFVCSKFAFGATLWGLEGNVHASHLARWKLIDFLVLINGCRTGEQPYNCCCDFSL